MIIFAGKVHQSVWYDSDDHQLPSDWVIALSDNGWTNDALGLFWLKNMFDKHTKNRTIGRYRLLILDGHGSHGTAEFDRYCSENSIIALCMPPHSSHLLQPLDVACFSVLKQKYGNRIAENMQLGINHIDKQEFLAAYPGTRAEALNTNNIKAGFTATGLIPFNPSRVLSKLQTGMSASEPDSETPETRTPPEPQPEAHWTPKTPRDIRTLEMQADALTQSLAQLQLGSEGTHTKRAIAQIVKGCQMAMHNALILDHENKRLTAANKGQKKKRAKNRSYIATGGTLTVAEGAELAEQANRATEPSERTRAPPRCSLCRLLSHKANRCPDRQETQS
jgi:hypothetical protein